MTTLQPGAVVDGFVLGDLLHRGGMALIHEVRYADGRAAPFPMVMKVPRMTAGDGAETIVSFEVEHQIMQAIGGPHVPRLVAAGDLSALPYLVMEYVPGRTLDRWLDQVTQGQPLAVDTLARLGAAVAAAAHALHQQNAVHLDLKPANVIIRDPAADAPGDAPPQAVLLDFGLSCHAHYPDLLAEEMRAAVGSPAYMSPEQVVGVRGDPRSDVFAIGVLLYELATGELPFGAPASQGGLRQRLWMDPRPPRARRPDLPEWLQEVILRCLEPTAAERYPSAAHLAFDLAHPEQVQVGERGRRLKGTGFRTHFKRWLRAAGTQYQPSPLPQRLIGEVPILMVAVPHRDASDATLYSLREAVARSLGIRPGARLAVVTVLAPSAASNIDASRSETALHRRMLAMLRQWAQGLPLDGHQTSYHVLEDSDPADAIVRYAEANHVDIIVMGAATHGLQLQRFVATVPVKVAMRAPCTLILVKQAMPFEQLAEAP
jgi:serine/threonine protein kinase